MKWYIDGFFDDNYEFGTEITEEYWQELLREQANGKEIYDDNGYPKSRDRVLTDDETIEVLRANRVVLLEAFDKWEKAVIRGREEESTEVMEWYQELLDLEQSAFDKVPLAIQYYL